MRVRTRPSIRHPLASGDAVVVYVVDTRRFIAVSPPVAAALDAAEQSGEWSGDRATVARDLADASLLEIAADDAPGADSASDNVSGTWWIKPMVHQLATPLQTPFDPSEPDAWEEPPQ